MNTLETSSLPPGALWASADAPALRCIRCTGGTLWLTQAGSARDVLLHPGDTFTPAPVGKIVIEALTPAAFACRPLPCAAPLPLPSLARQSA